MPYTIESDKSRQIKWVVREDTDVSLTITVTLAAAPYNLSSYTFICEIFKIGSTSPILTLTQGSGITNNGAAGTLVLALTNTQLDLTPNEYFWKLRTTAPTDNIWFNGIFQVNGYTYDATEDNSLSVALTIGGDSLNVSLVVGDSSFPFRGNYDPSGGTFPSTGGNGTGGAPAFGDFWQTTVDGTIASMFVPAGSFLWARQDSPSSDWSVLTGWKLI